MPSWWASPNNDLPECSRSIRVFEFPQTVKEKVCAWAESAGWAPIEKRKPMLVFRRKHFIWWTGLEVEVDITEEPGTGYVDISFIASALGFQGSGGYYFQLERLQKIVDAFAEAASAKL